MSKKIIVINHYLLTHTVALYVLLIQLHKKLLQESLLITSQIGEIYYVSEANYIF